MDSIKAVLGKPRLVVPLEILDIRVQPDRLAQIKFIADLLHSVNTIAVLDME